MATDARQTALIERLRHLLEPGPPVREVTMFGGRSFMVRDKLVVSAMRGGDLLVRAPAERHAELLSRPGAAQAEMGAGRTMGPGWITVSAEAIGADDHLSFWLDIALGHDRTTSSNRR